MADIRRVTSDFAVAPQLAPEDMPGIAAQGFRLVVNNRPDGEVPGQPSSDEVRAAAEDAGLAYVHVPILGPASPSQVQAVRQAVTAADGPALAFCRSGTRSVTVWARGEVAAEGGRSRDEVLKAAREVGYDLSQSI